VFKRIDCGTDRRILVLIVVGRLGSRRAFKITPQPQDSILASDEE
jgi:hypothetical protein